MRLAGVATLMGLIFIHTAFAGEEIGFPEKFALAENRTEALNQLVPGTEDHYFYSCLHLQNQGKLPEVDALLKPWIERYGRTPRVQEIENRQALLRFPTDPAASFTYLRARLNLVYPHERETLENKPNLPTTLPPEQVSRETLNKKALDLHDKTLEGFEDRALDWVAREAGRGQPDDIQLSAERRRDLLRRLTRPDYPGLVPLVLADLKEPGTSGFGSCTLHGALLLNQLEECLKGMPELRNTPNFIQTYLSKLKPAEGSGWPWDAQERQAYLERQWAFVSTLEPVHLSLKANVLYNRLLLDRSQGVYDKERFMTYLALPRQTEYVNPKYLEQAPFQGARVDLSLDFQSLTTCPPIGNDEKLVRDFLQHFFQKETDYKPYAPYIREDYLKMLYAETQLLLGQGDAAQWTAWLPPARYQELRDRVEIEFAPENKRYFASEDPVGLDLDIKNVQDLIVKVYEINAQNYYREKGTEISTDINLDGLVANSEKTVSLDKPPLLRVRQRFELPELAKPGVYGVEIIGNGKSSRALIQKGRLSYLARTGSAGYVFTILDEKGRKAPDASLWLAGHAYTADKNGEVAVPFSTNPGPQKIVLTQGNLSSLAEFNHDAEHYALSAGLFVDRESVLKHRKAQILVRPVLLLNGTRISLKALEEPTLLLTTVDREGISATQTIEKFPLFEDRVSSHTFQVPENLIQISFTLTAKVQNMSQNKKETLTDSASLVLNQIDTTDKIEALHLAHTRVEGSAQYLLELLGKTGEPRPDRPVNLTLKHRDYRDPIQTTCQTDTQGQIHLGPLDDIEWVEATGPQGVPTRWDLKYDQRSWPTTLDGRAGEPLRIPVMENLPAGNAPNTAAGNESLRSLYSLIEVRGGIFVRDCFDSLKLEPGFLSLLVLPEGDYDLWLKESGRHILIRLTAVVPEASKPEETGYLLGKNRYLETPNPQPLQISQIETTDNDIRIQLANAGPNTTVQVVATRYLPFFPLFGTLGKIPFAEPFARPQIPADSLYLSSRNIGDEYRYILERRYAQKFPGNMLARPGLLLNPWVVRQTSTEVAKPAEGEAVQEARPQSAAVGQQAAAAEAPAPPPIKGDYANLDFLPMQSVVLCNLRPDAEGIVQVSRKTLAGSRQLHVFAMDRENSVYREQPLPDSSLPAMDLRLRNGLEPKSHFTEQKLIHPLKEKETFEVPDITTAEFEVYDTLGAVFNLYETLSKNPTLREFSFVTDWPRLAPEKKRELYSKYACHELNFFLFQKDRAFFKETIWPYLLSKKDKTFLDDYLLAQEPDGPGNKPLEAYLKPQAYERLNAVERILLGRQLQNETPTMQRHVRDLFDLIPTDLNRADFLFKTALRGRILETPVSGGAAGMAGGRVAAGAYFYAYNGDLAAKDTPALLPTSSLAAVRNAAELGVIETNGPAAAGQEDAALTAPAAPAPAGKPSRTSAASKSEELRLRLDLDKKQMVVKDLEEERIAGNRQERSRSLKHLATAKEKAGVELADKLEVLSEADLARRGEARKFYQKLDKTQEWAENNYYHVPREQQNADRVKVNGFWRDYANHVATDEKAPFLSQQMAEASGSFTEIFFALSVLDLPFEAAKHDVKTEDQRLRLQLASPAVIYRKEIRAAQKPEGQTPILVSQNFFRLDDRFRFENNEQLDKYVSDEFLCQVVYGCRVALTNPSSSIQKVEVLLQIPQGAVPVNQGRATRSVNVELAPFSTWTNEYAFYFPLAGEFGHYPVHVSRNGALLASAEPCPFKVVEKPSKIDTTSWSYISQNGTEEETLNYLQNNNINRLDLERIAWRMKNAGFFEKAIALLDARHVYHQTLWSYALLHQQAEPTRQFLSHCNDFVQQCGAFLDTPLLKIDPVERGAYEHLEYSPLVNARTHQLGKERTILNDRFREQYQRLMNIFCYRPQLNDTDRLAVVCYLLMQDRLEEALACFSQVKRDQLETPLQYDYCAAWLALTRGDTAGARTLAQQYAQYPVDRWRKQFEAVLAQVNELEGQSPQVIDKENRTERQTELAATEPGFDFKVEARRVQLQYQNLTECRVQYYLMDVELLFSREPFIQADSNQFTLIKPNATDTIKLDPQKNTFEFELPKQFHNRNVMVEILGAGLRKSQACYANSLNVQVTENYGQLQVLDAATRQPQSKVYVKVYARLKDGTIQFYKDGYTDLRGRFDYTSLSTDELDRVERFSLLILSDTSGAVVREAQPPKR
jgi:hypothetical protein